MKGGSLVRERKVIKKEKQQLLFKLSDLYREDGFITDHEVETLKDCILCENIRAWKIIVERLDEELEILRIFNISAPFIPPQRKL